VLFRSRGARLTEKGEHLLALAREMLAVQERMLDLKRAHEMPARRLRLGVTELSALTWLPRLVGSLRKTYPSVVIEAEVDMSRNLYDRLQEDTVDLKNRRSYTWQTKVLRPSKPKTSARPQRKQWRVR
jgi:DNA-binding transcriptional LysR family regulator